MPYEKYLSWIEPETGDITSRRKSPKRCSVYDAMFELYKIKAFLKNQNLKVTLLLIDMEEYKLLNGWSYDKKRGSVRYDRIPVGGKNDSIRRVRGRFGVGSKHFSDFVYTCNCKVCRYSF